MRSFQTFLIVAGLMVGSSLTKIAFSGLTALEKFQHMGYKLVP